MKNSPEKITLVIFLKTLFTWGLVAILVAILYAFFIIPAFLICLIIDRKEKKLMFYLTRFVIRTYFKLYVTSNFTIDLGNIKRTKKPRVYILNHASQFDTFLMYLLPGIFKVFVKQVYVNIPFIGGIMRVTGNIIIVKKPDDMNYESDLLDIGKDVIKRGYTLLVFPEGTKSKSGDIGRFKSGGFRIAYQTKAEIVPVVLDTWNSIRPGGGWWIRDDKIWMRVLKPYQFEDYKDYDLNDFIKLLKVQMTEELIQIRDQRRLNEKKYYRNAEKYKIMDKKALEKVNKIKERLKLTN
jgi:1-acyl-sn-glycerol-3-phosphate acyltransferase